MNKEINRWGVVAFYAMAMAWVESAVVFYLRTMVDRIQPYQEYPLPMAGGLGQAEFIREAATLVMLLTIGLLAGRGWRSRFGYAAIAFGIWDIFYYVFLKVMCDWPASLLDWDILFLIPLPWWGPVLAPVLIATLMIVWGSMAVFIRDEQVLRAAGWKAWACNALGIVLALYVFMTDALKVSDQGLDALRRLLPATFNWPLFLVSQALMAAPIVAMLWQMAARTPETKIPAGASA